jgi:transketolase
MKNKDRIIQISKKLDLSHIGSNLSCLPVLEAIYKEKKPEDIVILDNAHAHLAHLVVKDSYISEPKDSQGVERMIQEHGIHCDRANIGQLKCDASGGSLGHGLGIGIGYALANRKRDVYVIVSEGSMMEGSSWEALRIIDDLKLMNVKIHTNFNGYSAVAKIDDITLAERMKAFVPDITVHFTKNGEGFDGIEGHYKKA